MSRSFPSGWFEGDLVCWGESLDARAFFTRGGLLEVPDVRQADNRTVLELAAQNALFLATLGEKSAFQLQWTVESDFGPALEAYEARRQQGSQWSRRTNQVRAGYYQQRLAERSLRRERVHLYLGRRCEDLGRRRFLGSAECAAYVGQVARELDAQSRALPGVFSAARWQPLGAAGHCAHLRKFLNPALSASLLADPAEAVAGFDPSHSVRHNCLRSELAPFSSRGASGQEHLLALDGHYHALFVMRDLPRGTRPGMLVPILGSVADGAAITLNVYPLAVDVEIDRLRREIIDLSLFLSDKKSVGVENDILLRRARIDSLLTSVTIPFKMLFVIRVWDQTLEGLSAKTLALKTALYRIDGAVFVQVTSRAQALHLFYETIPGNLGSNYRGWDLYIENRNLADLLPISSAFSGHLDGAQALYDSPDGSLVGVRLLAGDGTPQHSMVVGVNGAGKSAFLIDLLSQSDPDWSYRFIQEEGLAFATLARLTGLESLILKESGERTLNPFDTFGLPLTSHNLAGVVRTCMKLIGLSRDEDRNRRREGLIGEYVHAHFHDFAEDWKNADEERWHRLARQTLLAQRLIDSNEELLDGFTALRERESFDGAWAVEALAALSEEEVMAFALSRRGEEALRAMVFSAIPSEAYPQFSGLVSLMRHARRSHHRSGAVGEELDFISTELAKGRRIGGVVGSFIDGPTSVDLRGAGLHLDTSFLPDGLLKELAGFVVFDRVRVGADAVIRRAILDKDVVISAGATVGVDHDNDRARGFTVTESGITVVGKGVHVD